MFPVWSLMLMLHLALGEKFKFSAISRSWISVKLNYTNNDYLWQVGKYISLLPRNCSCMHVLAIIAKIHFIQLSKWHPTTSVTCHIPKWLSCCFDFYLSPDPKWFALKQIQGMLAQIYFTKYVLSENMKNSNDRVHFHSWNCIIYRWCVFKRSLM